MAASPRFGKSSCSCGDVLQTGDRGRLPGSVSSTYRLRLSIFSLCPNLGSISYSQNHEEQNHENPKQPFLSSPRNTRNTRKRRGKGKSNPAFCFFLFFFVCFVCFVVIVFMILC